MNYSDLIKDAFDAMKNSYSPYSNFPVGACILMKDGKKFIGTNIENASLSATMCAERVAVFSAYANGYKKDDIEALAIVSNAKTLSAPCGVCRQVLNELINKNTPIILSNGKETLNTTIEELLPYSFGPEDLK